MFLVNIFFSPFDHNNPATLFAKREIFFVARITFDNEIVRKRPRSIISRRWCRNNVVILFG